MFIFIVFSPTTKDTNKICIILKLVETKTKMDKKEGTEFKKRGRAINENDLFLKKSTVVYLRLKLIHLLYSNLITK